MQDPFVYFSIGCGVHLIFFLAYKLLRRNWYLVVAIAISLILVAGGFNLQGFETLQMKKGYAANWLFSPAFFLITFTTTRYLFKLIFKNEPIMAGYMQRSWNQGEYRRLHLGDSLFTVINMLLPMLIPLWI
ncbi:MAG: hypothetical protein ACFHU9_11000 [Fluviicola sp.]